MSSRLDNVNKTYQYIIGVYWEHKQEDIPDTRIVCKIFPSYGIFISYRTWMRIKGKKPSELNTTQLSLF